MKIISKKYLKTRLVSFSALVFFACFLILSSAFSFADTITYQYDASNRLTGVEYSSGATIEYSYDAGGNMLTKKVLLRAECTECSSSPVELTNVTFASGTRCQCRDNTSITLGSEVIIERGADITFIAPVVNVKSGFEAKPGSVVKIKQE